MKLTWLGHACFLLEEDGYRIVLDPYTGVAGYPPLHIQAHAVFCSHGHFDHHATDCVEPVSYTHLAEFLAWFMGAPATLFLIPALLIPLVPGRPLYYAMYYAVQQDMDLSADFARQTALYALGIALGASLVWALADMRRHLKQNGFGN